MHTSRPRVVRFILISWLWFLPASCVQEAKSAADDSANTRPAELTGLLNLYGDYDYAISPEIDRNNSRTIRVRQYFNLGLTLAFAFNHQAAERAFRYAAVLSGNKCIICRWGVAYSLGPDLNRPMRNDKTEACDQLLLSEEVVSEKIRRYVAALKTRYLCDLPNDKVNISGFRTIMKQLYQEYPEDDETAVLYAEALLMESPWVRSSYTNVAMKTLEAVLRRSPHHIGANHFYIHAVEMQRSTRYRGLASASELLSNADDLGHLLHMASHIFSQTGRYAEASLANRKAIEADERYFCESNGKVMGYYCKSYYAHNWHMLAFSAAMEGRCEEAVEAADRLAEVVGARGGSLLVQQWRAAAPWLMRLWFGRWEEIQSLMKRTPPTELPPFTAAIARLATHVVQAAKEGAFVARHGDIKNGAAALWIGALLSEKERGAIVELAIKQDQHPVYQIQWENQIKLAQQILRGVSGENSVESLTLAVAEQDNLDDRHYKEPPLWPLSVRWMLGGLFLSQGDAVKAEQAFGEDLERNPENGWSLFGLMKSLEAQAAQASPPKTQRLEQRAADARVRFERAWQNADVELVMSKFGPWAKAGGCGSK